MPKAEDLVLVEKDGRTKYVPAQYLPTVEDLGWSKTTAKKAAASDRTPAASTKKENS